MHDINKKSQQLAAWSKADMVFADADAGVRAKVEHRLSVLKRQFAHLMVRYQEVKKNKQ